MSARSNTRVPVSFDNKSAAEFFAKIFDAEYGDHRSKAKAVAAHTAGVATPRTAQTWARKSSAPSAAAVLNMLIGPKPIPALQAEVRRLLAATADHAMTPERAIQEIQRMLVTMEKT